MKEFDFDPVERTVTVNSRDFRVDLNKPVIVLQDWSVDKNRICSIIDEVILQYIFEGYSLENRQLRFKADAEYSINGLYEIKKIDEQQKEDLLDILEESQGNIITPRKVNKVWTHPTFQVTTAHNGAVVKLKDGTYVMLFRSHLRDGRSIIGKATSIDGVKWDIAPWPAMLPATETEKIEDSSQREEIVRVESGGLEDPRICEIYDTNLNKPIYLITYSGYFDNENKVYPSMAITSDFNTFTRMGPVIRSKARNTIIFPKVYEGNVLYGLTRMSYGEFYQKIFLIKTQGSWREKRWETLNAVTSSTDGPNAVSKKIGPGATPLLLDDGWFLSIEHGGRETVGGMNYVLRAVMYNVADPSIVKVSNIPILYPETDIKYKGYQHVDKIVFTTGVLMEKEGSIKIYLGSNDTIMKIAVTHVDIMKSLIERYPQNPESGTAAYDLRRDVPPGKLF